LCTGAAVPAPDWSRFLQDEASVPTRCSDGGGVLIDNAPGATLISPSYQPARSWRASLEWATSVRWLQITLRNLASWDRSQASVRDVNFAGTQRFALAQEGGRPVFVSAAAIDPQSGAVSPVESRRSVAYGRVAVRESALRGYGAQSTITMLPDVFRLRNVPFSPFVSVSYTLQTSRRQFVGFDGKAAGDPRAIEWAPSQSDARQIVLLQGAFTVKQIGTITFFGRAQSGLPFTPTVQGDINGDGRSGDRAFIPSASLPLDATLATQLRALQESGSASARQCVAAFAGQIAPRNGCRGPWTATLNAQWSPRLPKAVRSRLTANVFFDNVLAGMDQALHGSRGLRGWGGAALPDPVLLVPRAFDATARAFRYDINPRFAETRPARTTFRNPFRLTLDFSLSLSTNYDLQQLRRAVEPVRGPKGFERRTRDSLTALYLRETSNIHTALLGESDSLFLTPEQSTTLKRADSVYSAQVRQIYGELAAYLSQLDGSASKAALDSSRAAKKAYWKVFWQQPEIAGAIVSPSQRELMPVLRDMLSVPKTSREGSQWYFGSQVKFVPPKPVGPTP
jgi:hypothetical protein